ncbi:nucleoporin Nsp1 [Penicillium odoratum]|uniref:nucleoporin Nsp1 n=1 Tax=Penicillium odoratum TaxID=1167516 RepID=UPI0025490F9A|nr:nucleoporin Nsp1 [Penicillium odoratum]KAJ5751843.1 nucleoporin Nsp1 [Penicillium odoratum]
MFGNNNSGGNKPLFGSAAGTGSAFGSNQNTSNAGSTGPSLFGNVGATPAGGASASPFGGNSGTQPSLFGSGTTSNTTSSGSFGSNTATSGGTFSFGQAQKPAGQSGSLFGGNSTPAKTEAATPTPTAGGNIFGGGGGTFGTSTTPGPSGGSLFGNNSTTPAGPPPASKTPLFGTTPAASTTPSSAAPFSTTPATTQPQTTGSLFGGGASTTPAAPKLAFGSTPTTGSGGLFGSKPAESTTTPATTADSTPKPSMFGNAAPAASAPSTQGSTPSLFKMPSAGGDSAAKPAFSLGAPAASTGASLPSLGAPAASTATPQKSLFTGLGGTTSSAAQSSTPAAAPTGLFAPKPSTSTPATAATTSAPAATPAAPAPLGGMFGKPATSTPASQPAAATTTAAADKTTTATAPSTTTTAGTAGTGTAALGQSTTGPAPPAQSRLKNKTMDEIITRWATDLTKYQKEFREQAEKVAEWDRMLVENGTKVQKLYGSTVDAERATQEVERQLASVEGQQDELSSWLDRYEREVDEMVSKQGSPGDSISGPDQERERTYKLAEKLSERLDEMGKDLTSMIEEVNAASATLTKTNRADEPISQIVRILNSHLSQLQVIDQGTSELQAKVAAAQKAGQSISSRLGYGYASPGMGGGHAADDFYRSYMGRR